MATSSISSTDGSIGRCDCGRKAKMYTSWSLKNPGRRFYTCGQPSDNRCDYFKWYDLETEGRHGDVINQLNNRLIFLGEKVRLLEDRIAYLEGKIASMKAKKIAERKQLVKLMKIFGFGIVLVMAVMVFRFI